MDTRRLSEPIVAAPLAPPAERDAAVEVVELTAVERPRLGLLPRLVFVVGIAVMAGLIAMAGLPSRSSFAFDSPLPNVFQVTPAP
jgi:hypothetical protein